LSPDVFERRRRRCASIVAAVLVGACATGLVTGCSSASGASEPAADAGAPDDVAVVPTGDEVVHTYAPTFSALWAEVFTPSCAFVFCHGGTDDFLSMATQSVAYEAMVGAISHGPECGSTGLTIVQPGDPDASLLYLKVTSPPCGNKMPAMYGLVLDDRELAQIKQWITLGAQND
jgi:hypothetical protein